MSDHLLLYICRLSGILFELHAACVVCCYKEGVAINADACCRRFVLAEVCSPFKFLDMYAPSWDMSVEVRGDMPTEMRGEFAVHAHINI